MKLTMMKNGRSGAADVLDLASFYFQDTWVKVHPLKFFELQLAIVDVLWNIKIWRLAPDFDIWKNFN